MRFAGDSGDGMQLSGGRFGAEAAFAGNQIITLPNFPAEIRAPQGSLSGVSSFQIHIASEKIFTPGDELDALVAMNPAALRMHLDSLRHGGLLIVDRCEFTRRNLNSAGYETDPLDLLDGQYRLVSIDMTSITKEAVCSFGLKRKAIQRTRNMLALGIVCWAFSTPIENTISWLGRRFASDPIVRDANMAALQAGYHLGETMEILNSPVRIDSAHYPPGRYRQITGIDAIALGLLSASELSGMELFFSAYPITPASELLHSLAKRASIGPICFQAEDEIAAAGAALGASFGGLLGVCATSGPGFTLKQETINLAVMCELPLVIIDIQRAGPSTGMPTKTEQSDLLQALWGRNGDSPLPVYAISSVESAFDTVIEACRTSIETRTPVIVLADAYLAQSSQPWAIPNLDNYEPIDPHFTTDPTDFAPYIRDESHRRLWAIPGTAGCEHVIGGLEKSDRDGHISYDPDNHDIMTRARADKITAIKPSFHMDEPDPKAPILLIGWGSTWGALQEACHQLRESGYALSHLHLSCLNPLPDLQKHMRKYRHIIVCETNSGQLNLVLRARYLVDTISLTHVKGTPLNPDKVIHTVTSLQGGMDDE